MWELSTPGGAASCGRAGGAEGPQRSSLQWPGGRAGRDLRAPLGFVSSESLDLSYLLGR